MARNHSRNGPQPLTEWAAVVPGDELFTIVQLTDKHGISREAYSLQVEIRTDGGRSLRLGLNDADLPGKPLVPVAGGEEAPETVDGYSVRALNKRILKSLTEE